MMHIIYVEDDPSNIALVERVVRMAHDTLTTYTTAEEALLHIQPGDADLILTDVDFGEDNMTGLELTQGLRSKGIDVPIVAITAYDLQEYVRWSEMVGSDGFIVKPVNVPELLNLLEHYRPVE
ncbi:MAG: response regulator [Chloroflexi bacterium]|nr:response regulator [Chloroflexota bacterium]